MEAQKRMDSNCRLLCDMMADAFGAVDLEGRIRGANQAFLDLVGYKKEELLGMSLFDLTPDKWHPLQHQIISEQVMVRGYSDVFQKEYRRKNGSIVPVELRVTLSRDSDDKPIGMWAIVRDISQRIDRQENLRRFQHSVESSPDAVYWINAEGRFLYVNAQACQSLGYSPDELMRLHLWDIDADFKKEQWESHWQAVGEAGGARLERRHKRKDGTLFPVEITSRQILLNRQKHHVAYVRNITERKKAYNALRFFKHAMDTSPDGFFVMPQDGGFTYVNDQACRSLGYRRDELLRMHLWDIDPDFTPERWSAHWKDMRSIQSRLIETAHRRRDGSTFPIEVMAYRMPFGDKERHLAFVRDISDRQKAEKEREKLQAQLLQSQKLESIGRLAGGVAHDFNNMLSVILGSYELIKTKLAPNDPLLRDLDLIDQAATRSKHITQQLLAFSRKQIFEPKILDVNHLIRGLERTLASMIGEDIELVFFPCSDEMKIEFDPVQFEQIVLNLAVNARDAMPGGGKLTLETAHVVLDEAYCRDHAESLPGDFVRLSVSDNGEGMRSEIASRIFDPFFTTKEVGKGTGLGLSTVYGIVKQAGGFINVYSEPGLGTTFKIYILRAEGDVEPAAPPDDNRLETGSETILLVEDDDMVRTVTKVLLENLGYKVVSTVDPEEALSIFEKERSAIDLLLTDMVMPKMNGKELHDKLKLVRPGLKALFMSGYTTSVIVHHGALDKDVHFIAKPFQIDKLARKVRKAIDAG